MMRFSNEFGDPGEMAASQPESIALVSYLNTVTWLKSPPQQSSCTAYDLVTDIARYKVLP